jgi:hypothetical protein
MKKYSIVAIIVLTLSLFSQFEITKHKAFPSVVSGLMINAERFTGNTLTNISIPYGVYQLEGKTNEKAMYYLYVDGGFKMNKLTPSDELPENEQPGSTNDAFAYDMKAKVNPYVKYFMKDSTFITIGLPFQFISKQEYSDTREDSNIRFSV